MAANDNMRDELLNMQKQINETTDKSVASTRRMVKHVNEAEDAGIKTLVMLDHQGEQLQNVDLNMDNINENMKDTENNLDELEKCCGLCICPWNKRQVERDDFPSSSMEKTGTVKTSQPVRSKRKRRVKTGEKYIDRVTEDAREDEMDENLGTVDDVLGNLKEMAIDMGGELNKQNDLVDNINSKASSNKSRIDDASKRADKLLKTD